MQKVIGFATASTKHNLVNVAKIILYSLKSNLFGLPALASCPVPTFHPQVPVHTFMICLNVVLQPNTCVT